MNMMGPGGCRPPPPEYKVNVSQNMGMCQTQFPAQGYMPPARQSLPQGAQSRRPIQQQPIPPSGKEIDTFIICLINVMIDIKFFRAYATFTNGQYWWWRSDGWWL